jgi:peptidoglycan glycosyltransferase
MMRILFLFFIVVSVSYSYKRGAGTDKDLEKVRAILNNLIGSSHKLTNQVKVKENNYNIEFNLNSKLESKIKKLFRRHRPDHGAIVIIENDTGNILAATDFTRKGRKFGRAMCFSNDHPAASIFKLITAADLIENTDVDSESKFQYRGRASTLYKYQLKDKVDRWTREQALAKAFSRSNNVIFAKAAINNSNSKSLVSMANKFKFNDQILEGVELEQSTLLAPTTQYELAELASGFNRGTIMSPVHGAVIGSIIANDGVYRRPSVISSIANENGRVLWLPSRETETVLKPESAKELQKMMELTVQSGTARRLYRQMKRSIRKNLDIGGKTGSLTGGKPFGKRDWLVVYAKPKTPGQGKGITVAVMLVNLKKWYVKSTHLAKKVIEYYYQDLLPLSVKNGKK